VSEFVIKREIDEREREIESSLSASEYNERLVSDMHTHKG
jgi:hypothetical protein